MNIDDNVYKASNFDEAKKFGNIPVALAKVIIVLSVIIVVLVVLLALLFPLKKTEYKLLVAKSAHENFVTVRDINQELVHDKVIRDFVLENYVIARETINNIDEDAKRRYKIVHAQSSDDVYTEFRNFYNTSEKIRSIDGFSRSVEVTSIVDIPGNVSIVEFALTDRYKRENNKDINKTTKYYKATISYEFTELKTIFADRTLNPLSINVIAYELAEVKRWKSYC